MLTIREENLRYSTDQLHRFLSAKIADFNSLSSSQKDITQALFEFCAANSSSSFFDFPVNFRIRRSNFTSKNIEGSSILSSNPKPLFSVLSGIVPLNAPSFRLDRAIDRAARYYAICGCAVVAAKMAIVNGIKEPMLFSLDVDVAAEPKSLTLGESSYQVYAVTLKRGGYPSLLSEYDFSEILGSLHRDGVDVHFSHVKDEKDFGYVVRESRRVGYKFSFDIDLLKGAIEQKTILCIVPYSGVDKFEKACGSLNTVHCGMLFDGVGENVIVKNGVKQSFSSILIDEIIFAAAQYHFSENLDVTLNPNGGLPVLHNQSAERSIQDILENVEYMSSNILPQYFDACINTYGTSLARSPFATYFSVKDVGRFLVSLETFVPDVNPCGVFDCALRVIFEHQAYSATPSVAIIKVVERFENAGEGHGIFVELVKLFNTFSIQYKVEREVDVNLSADFIFSFGLISKVTLKVSGMMSGFKRKGDVIFSVKLLPHDHHTADFKEHLDKIQISNSAISHLIRLKLVNAISPIARGGLFYTLFSMAECQNLGFDITSDMEISSNLFLFKESVGQAVLVVSEEYEAQFVDCMRERKIPITLLGHVTKGEIRIDDVSYGFIADLKKKVSFAFQNNIKKMTTKKVVKPYEDSHSTKKEQVANMFDNIASKYDFLNHFLSLGIDKIWRKKLVKEVGMYKPSRILDVATGTGDLAIALSKLKPQSIVGIDIAVKMVEVGVEKVKDKKLDDVIFLQQGDSEMINYDSNTFDFATVAFGVRNFENPSLGLREIHRVLKQGGGLAVLEFAMPTKFPIKQFYKFYFFKILPFIGQFFSKDKSAYTYLPESVEAFPSGAKFLTLLKEAGFAKTRIIPLTFGVANIYIGEK